MENLFSPTPITRAPFGKPNPPLWLFPGYGMGRGSYGEPEHQRALADWLSKRAGGLYAAANPVNCTVVWYQARYRTNDHGDPVRASRVVSGRFEVGLH
jgi:hypothetical protein